MTLDYEQNIKANATPQNIQVAQSAIMRLEAMRGAVTVQQHKGTKAHTWLSPTEVKQITGLCNDSRERKRDWIILGLLLGAGLRREELAALKFDAIKSQPTKNGGARVVLEVKGKRAKDRIIPVNAVLAAKLYEWQQLAGSEHIARASEQIRKADREARTRPS
jgi:site-specific recombinase XerD